MKPATKQPNKKTAFTIVELLTVMGIIIVLIGLLFPAMNMVKRHSKEVKQKAQFHSIEAALELFSNDWDDYPPSGAEDEAEQPYCGAMKLCEAMVGQDLIGFHPNSRFRADGTFDGTNPLYATSSFTPPPDNLRLRKRYLQSENVNAYRLWQLYGSGKTSPFQEDLFVLCDVYSNVKNKETGKKVGMPILYYKANTSNTLHDANDPDDSIYNYLDNDELVTLEPGKHPLDDGTTTNFYKITRDKKITNISIPYRPDSYILISAGFDGLYGTDDDIYNFEK